MLTVTKSLFGFHSFLHFVFYIVTSRSQTVFNHCISLDSSSLGLLLCSFLFLMTLIFLKSTGQIFCRMSLNLGFLAFSWLAQGCGFLKKYHRNKMPFSSHHIWGTWINMACYSWQEFIIFMAE